MPRHGIKVVVLKTGLSAHALRVWEKRYGAVTPHRTQSNRRIYTDAELERLMMLVKLTRSGYQIGQIAHLSDRELAALAESAQPSVNAAKKDGKSEISNTAIAEAMEAVQSFDQKALEDTLDRAILTFGYSGLLEKVIVPLMCRVGELWSAGEVSAACEHAASNFIKEYLACRTRPIADGGQAPRLLVTTPAGQMHELGAYIAGCMARKSGWHVVYLGASLPAEEIAGAARQIDVAAILLSIVYPMDDPQLGSELIRLRRLVSPNLPILVGGCSAGAYEEVLKEIDATQVHNVSELTNLLSAARSID